MKHRINAFTLAEVLITLGIIGVVAAITIPTLVNKNNEKIRETQLKKAYSTLSQVNRLMLAKGTYPYEEFVFAAKIEEDITQPDTGNNDNVTESEKPETDNDGSGNTNNTPPSEEKPSAPDLNDQSTKDLVEQIANNIIGALLGDKDAQNAIQEAYDSLSEKYGNNNIGDFLQDYFKDLFGNNIINTKNAQINFKHIFAITSNNSNENSSNNFIERKKRQLQILKQNFSGAQYCKSYQYCKSSTEKTTYYNLTGNEEATIEAAEFENSALILADGGIIWLGDENNPQRYYYDINGVKGPNRLGIDVFTFNISSKNTINAERTGNCTKTNTPTSGESYRGLGCSGYAIADQNPDTKEPGYWKYMK